MAKKRWWIKELGNDIFSVWTPYAFFNFNEMKEFERCWEFYLDGDFNGRLFKSNNIIVNLDDFADKIPLKEVENEFIR